MYKKEWIYFIFCSNSWVNWPWGHETRLDEVSISMKQTGRIRRFLSLALTLIMAVSLLPAAAAGESATQYGFLVIQSNTENRTVNFRRLPNTNDNTNYPLAHLPEYWVVQVLASAKGSGEDWYQVLANVNTSGGTAQYRTGYVMAKYVTLMTVQDYTAWINSSSSTYRPGAQPAQQPTQAPDAVVSPTQPPVGMSGFIRTIQQGVNLRESPDGKVLNENNQIPLGTVLAYYNLHIANGYTWALVQYDGKAGYVRSDCYAFSDAQGNLIDGSATQPPYTAPTPTQSSYTPDVFYGTVTADDVFFRMEMSSTSDYWGKLPKGWEMQVTDTTSINGKVIWYKVYGTLPGSDVIHMGYIAGDYFKINTPDPTVVPDPVYPTAAPYTGGYVKTTKGLVNIRRTPGGAVLTPTAESKLPSGKVLFYDDGPVVQNMDGQRYSWVRVTYKGITGYIRSDCYQYCDVNGKPVSAPTSAPTPAPSAVPGWITSAPTSAPAGQGYIKLIKGGVNLRRTPGGESQMQLAKGTVLPYFKIAKQSANSSESWYEVYYAPKGVFGYILTTMAQLCDADGKVVAPTAVPTAAPGVVVGYVATTASSVWLRRTPYADGETVGQVRAKGTVLTQVGPSVRTGVYEWFPVQTKEGLTGYIRGDYVFALAQWQLDEYNKTGVVPTPTPGPATPKPGNSNYIQTTANALWVRESPSTQAGTLGKLSIGTVTRFYTTRVTGRGTASQVTWYQIKLNGKVGWVHGNYVRVLSNAEYDALYATPTPTPYNPVPVITPNPTSYVPGAPTPTATSYQPVRPAVYRTLRKNSTGDDVYSLQYKLAQLGYLAWDQVTGVYLTSTEKAVIAFQKDNKLTVDGLAGKQTQTALYNYVSPGVTATPQPGVTTRPDGYHGSVDVTLYPVEKIDWYSGGIKSIWGVGDVAIITDVYTGISFRAQRLYGDNHADCEPLTTADTAAVCQIYGVSHAQEMEDRNQELQSWRRRPLWVTIGGRTFCASMYGIPHNYDGDRIPDNGYNGQFCVHFTNSRTHTTNIVDPDADYNGYFGHQSAIQYAYEHSISGWK